MIGFSVRRTLLPSPSPRRRKDRGGLDDPQEPSVNFLKINQPTPTIGRQVALRELLQPPLTRKTSSQRVFFRGFDPAEQRHDSLFEFAQLLPPATHNRQQSQTRQTGSIGQNSLSIAFAFFASRSTPPGIRYLRLRCVVAPEPFIQTVTTAKKVEQGCPRHLQMQTLTLPIRTASSTR